ncbi:hypothetical protein B0H15DRAFT_1022594 [Mycena belliarum]|uniref:Uncharacterized protein n=1 Tax=Mycena belliarum TaxID=1033014 RepID=A0AAD6U340_9AGAR|nr:hypothetical protein B0H15DRAFT_1022594 [Mycena belliae]
MLPSLLLCVLLLGGLPCTLAQAAQLFNWGFTDTVSTSLPSCRSLAIAASPLAGHGVPPFYMISFAVDGAPMTDYVGNNESDLNWTVRHPVAGSAGGQPRKGLNAVNPGGVDVPMYTVIVGASTQCIPQSPPDEDFTIAANVTDTLTTCQPWGVTIRGGTPPYNVTVAALNSTVVTNVTLGPQDSVFTYINRAAPDTQMIAAASDLNGRWATGGPLVRTEGSANVECTGSISTGSNVTQQAPSAIPAHGAPMSRAHIGAIAGAGAAGLLLVFTAILWVVRRRRRSGGGANTVSPFGGYGIDGAPFRYAYSPTVRESKSAGSQAGSRYSVQRSALTSASSSPSSLPHVRELPPPYASPRLQGQGS